MQCPVCQFGNFPGDDTCANCGADLWTVDVPEPATGFQGRLLGAHLDELGAPAPQTVPSGMNVETALEQMRTQGLDCLLVLDGPRLAGIFTDRDAVLKLAGRPRRAIEIDEVMTRDPVVLRHDDPIAVAINKMAVGGFRHVPIMDGDRPTGVVSAKDVFRHIAARIG
ncbi:MAG: CBS domain-containing protein [Chloroflexi bacterium]|nr:CBS domain-containing protein [Chloroflexota bacterium]